MKDMFKTAVIPILACEFGTTICFLWGTGQEIPQLLWVFFLGCLGELGIEIGVKKVRKK